MCDHFEEREEEEQKSSVDDDLDNFDGGDIIAKFWPLYVCISTPWTNNLIAKFLYLHRSLFFSSNFSTLICFLIWVLFNSEFRAKT